MNNPTQTLRNIEGYVRSRFRYRSEDVETLRTVEKMLETLQETGQIFGDCDDVCIFIAALFLASGFRPRFVAIRTDQTADDFLHVIVAVMNRVFDVTVHPSKTTLISYGEPMEMLI